MGLMMCLLDQATGLSLRVLGLPARKTLRECTPPPTSSLPAYSFRYSYFRIWPWIIL